MNLKVKPSKGNKKVNKDALLRKSEEEILKNIKNLSVAKTVKKITKSKPKINYQEEPGSKKKYKKMKGNRLGK